MIDIEKQSSEIYRSIILWSTNGIFTVVPNWQNIIVNRLELFDSKINKIMFLSQLWDNLAQITQSLDLINHILNSSYSLEDTESKFIKVSEIIKFLNREIRLIERKSYSLIERKELESIIYPNHVDLFIEIEHELIDRNILSQNLQWISKSKKKLAILITGVVESNIIKPNIDGLNKKDTSVKYWKKIREFYQQRYQISDLKKELQLNRRKKYKIDAEFHFIKEILDKNSQI